HWVIVNDEQVEQGIREALARVEAEGVVVEGNSFLDYIAADLSVMCARAEGGKVKSSARRALEKSDFVYLSSLDANGANARERFEEFRASLKVDLNFAGLPILSYEDLPQLLSRIDPFGV